MTTRIRKHWLAAAIAVVALTQATPAPAAPGPSNEWLALARSMAAPWAGLQRPDGSFADYVVDAAPPGPPRDPYGRSFLGLALLQAGLRDGKRDQVTAGLEAIGAAARHPVDPHRLVFENLALATAYNIARAHLGADSRFRAVRPALEARLRRTRVTQIVSARPYYNYYLVEAAGLCELLASGLHSSVRVSALADRSRTRRLVKDLVNHVIPRVVRRYTTDDSAGKLTLISDPPWNPPAYNAFSLALLARIVGRLGPAAGDAPREVMRRAARALWTLAAPDGSISYYGRSQDQSWTLAMTAYGAEAAAALPNTPAADVARYEALAQRALARLRDDYAGGRFGFWITPALAHDLGSAIRGLDVYADAASYSGLTLVGLNWALEQMDADGPAAGMLGADAAGHHRLASGTSALEVMRTPSLWFAVKQGPGVFVKGSGDYRGDVRYDSGLVALQAIRSDGTPRAILPPRPHTLHTDDRAEPLLKRGGATGRFWGTALRATARGIELTGGYRAGSRWLRRGVRIRYEPAGCGLRVSITTRRHDHIEQALWFRRGLRIDRGGELITDPLQQLTLGTRPSRMSRRAGYASGTDVPLTRVQMRFTGTGRPLTFTFCPREALR